MSELVLLGYNQVYGQTLFQLKKKKKKNLIFTHPKHKRGWEDFFFLHFLIGKIAWIQP